MPIILTLASDSSFPWHEFTVALVAGLVSSLFGAAIGVIGSLWAISKTEFYRKASIWEPYSTSLWDARLQCFTTITEQLIYFERLTESMSSIADAFSIEHDGHDVEKLKIAFSEHFQALEQSRDSLFFFTQTRTLIIHPNIETAIVDLFESVHDFLKFASARMKTGLGMPVSLLHDEPPLPSKRELHEAAQTVKSEVRKILHLMANELKLFHLNVATADRFDTIASQLPVAAMERLVSGIIIKRPKTTPIVE
jgi:hypothetical protein